VQTEPVAVEESEMDREEFQVEEYLEKVMRKQGLEGMLTVEGRLVNGGLLFTSLLKAHFPFDLFYFGLRTMAVCS
jgi:hypothetical protein